MIEANSFCSPARTRSRTARSRSSPDVDEAVADRVAEQRPLRVAADVDRMRAAALRVELSAISTPSAVVIVPRLICCSSISGRRFSVLSLRSSASKTAQ